MVQKEVLIDINIPDDKKLLLLEIYMANFMIYYIFLKLKIIQTKKILI